MDNWVVTKGGHEIEMTTFAVLSHPKNAFVIEFYSSSFVRCVASTIRLVNTKGYSFIES